MTDETYETVESGIAILAASAGDIDWDDGPFPVRGVALPEDIVTNGSNTEGVSTYWPPETVEAATEYFDGTKIVDGSEHTAEEAMAKPQPSPDTIIGEITATQYQPGVGILYEGEVDDVEIAKRIERGRVDVSPTLFRQLGGADEERDAEVASVVQAVRDLSIVAKGAAAGNSIEPASNPAPAAMSALSAEALSAAFDESGSDTGAEALQNVSVHTPEFSSTTESEWNSPALEDFDTDDLSEVDDHFIVSLEGFPPENFGDLALPVVETGGALNLNALQNAAARAGQVSGLSGDALSRAESTIDSLANENFEGADFGAEANSEQTTEADSSAETDAADTSDDGSIDEENQSTDGRTDTKTMSDEDNLTDDQRELLASADRIDDPIVVESEHTDVLEAAAGCEEPHVVEQTDYEALQEDLSEAKNVLADALSERTGMDAEKIAENFSWEALREEFEDDDGNFEVEVLTQEPETGDADASSEDDTGAEALSEDADIERAEALYRDYEMLSRPPEALEADIVEALNNEVEDFDEAIEVLN